MSRMVAFCIDLKQRIGLLAAPHALAQCSASFFRISNAAGGEPRGTISTIGCILYSEASICGLSPPSWAAAATSFSPTCRLSLKRPRTRLVQTISAFRRLFSVSGRTPWLSSDLVSWSGEIRMRALIAA